MRAYGLRHPGAAPVWHAQVDSASCRLACTEAPGCSRPGASKEIEQLAGDYLDQPEEPVGPRRATVLDRGEWRHWSVDRGWHSP